MRYFVIALLLVGCATDQFEINPDVDPGNSMGVDVKSCFSQEALESKWGLGVPQIWNAMNGCKNAEEEETESEAD